MYKYVIQLKKDVTTNSTAISYNRWEVPKRITKTIQRLLDGINLYKWITKSSYANLKLYKINKCLILSNL